METMDIRVEYKYSPPDLFPFPSHPGLNFTPDRQLGAYHSSHIGLQYSTDNGKKGEEELEPKNNDRARHGRAPIRSPSAPTANHVTRQQHVVDLHSFLCLSFDLTFLSSVSD